ncbi:CRISPR-associated endoribonuclease Cas6 [Kyrpidia sp.]|uniref:CRISPR-associated endoribonuclease Cas6 n=1 Tax=Kyrpidia sp. TaxID=2073077 RepID=UPI00258696E3|nr:CRISPR-associated endoribonuclease Cas6 [Kyrpidia sp.]MCL6576731.1 hypothetical protein [Kyrpidia sp.]
MLRIRIDMPKDDRTAVCLVKAEQFKNLCDSALSRHGYRIDRSRPARYGFGVIAHPVHVSGPRTRRMFRIERAWIGSTDPEVVRALSRITSEDLYEPSDVSGAGLDLRVATITEEPWHPADAVAGYAISPIRVLQTTLGSPRGQSMCTFGPEFDQALNRTMERRFGRPFHLHFVPDAAYVRLHRGEVKARMGVRSLPDGKIVALDGVVLPFLLAGPPKDIRDAFYSGLGSATAQGFGWWDVSL